MQNKEQANTRILLIAIILIGVVVLITFLRSYYHDKQVAATEKFNTLEESANTNSTPTDSTQLSNDELLAKLNSQEKVIVIDMRDQDEFNKSHIVDSKNISLQNLNSSNDLVNKTASYVLINNGSTDDLMAAKGILQQKGAIKVFYLKNSYDQWASDDYPTISSGDTESFVDKSKVKHVTSDEFNSFINTDSNLLTIDLRSNANYQAGHIKGAINIPLDDLEKNHHQILTGKNIVVYDKDGLWAFQGAVRLFDLGFFNVLYLSDGFDAWQSKHYAIEK